MSDGQLPMVNTHTHTVMWRARSITMILFKLASAKLRISLLQCLHPVQSVITMQRPLATLVNGNTLSRATRTSSALAVDHGESLGHGLSPANANGVQDCSRCGNKPRHGEEIVSGQSLARVANIPNLSKYAEACTTTATGVWTGRSPWRVPCHPRTPAMKFRCIHSGKSCVPLDPEETARSQRTAKSLQQLRRCRHGETA